MPSHFLRRGSVTAEKTEALLQAEMIFGLVFHGEFAPIARLVTREECHRVLHCFCESSQSARRSDEAPEVEQGFIGNFLHQLISPFPDVAFALRRRGGAPRTRQQMPFMAGEGLCPPALSRARFVRSLERSGNS